MVYRLRSVGRIHIEGAINSLLMGNISDGDVHIPTDGLHCTGCHPVPLHWVPPCPTALGATLSHCTGCHPVPLHWVPPCPTALKARSGLTNMWTFRNWPILSSPCPNNCLLPRAPKYSPMPQPSKGRRISTTDQWTSAFLLFGAIYTQRFPNAAPGMFKYCDIVCDIAVTGPLFAWCQCDKQFRQLDPVRFSWDQPRWDLFFKVMYAKQVQGVSGRAPASPFNKPSCQPPFPTEYCWVYQRGGKCNTLQCKFKHVCAKCQLPHPAISCCNHIPPHNTWNGHSAVIVKLNQNFWLMASLTDSTYIRHTFSQFSH